MSAYNYDIVFKPGSQNANADVLSRLPLTDSPSYVPLPEETVLLLETLQLSPITAAQIKTWTDHDPILSQVRELVLQGWVTTTKTELLPYQRRRNELSIHDGCLLWGNRVVVPPPGRAKVIADLHDGHPGICRMKQLARCYVWWPNMDQELQKSPAQTPMHPWEWPQRPWSRLHIDYAGPFLGKMFLVTVDAHSKWIEADIVDSATSTGTIRKLCQMFATHGIPETIVSDNGSVFTSRKFQQFAKLNGIKHITTAPYHPASNGLAERAVQTIKTGLKKITSGTLEDRLSQFLFQYRLTPHSTTGTSPAELLMGRKPRSTLDLIKPNIADRVCQNQQRQKVAHDQGTIERNFEIGTPVFVKNFAPGPAWLSGSVINTEGNCSYIYNKVI